MKYASDYRQIARDSLTGRWGTAVIAGALASLLSSVGSSFSINLNLPSNSQNSISGLFSNIDMPAILDESLLWGFGFLTVFLLFALAMSLAITAIYFVLSSVVSVGYAKFNLNLLDRQCTPAIGNIFSFFSLWKPIALANLLKVFYTFLWTMLCIIPGIVASYSYAMTGYILAENPTLSASEVLARSKAMMEGNRYRLFCLHMSFIGWGFLCLFTCGIGFLWLSPYQQAATAAFYRDISGTSNEPVYITSPEL